MQLHQRRFAVSSSLAAAFAVAAFATGALGAASAPRASASSTCTDVASWNEASGTVKEDTCATGIRMTAACGESSIEGNTVYHPGQQFGIGAKTLLPFEEACENGNAGITVYLVYDVRGSWTTEASYLGYGTEPTRTYSKTWTAR